MINRKTFTIKGQNINSLADFHDEMQKVFCPNFKYYGRNWHAFSDILRGGFGSFELDEQIIIIFKNKKYVINRLGEGFINQFIKTVEKHKHIELIFE